MDTAVEDVTTPTRNANARRAATPKSVTAAARKKRPEKTCVFNATMAQIAPRR